MDAGNATITANFQQTSTNGPLITFRPDANGVVTRKIVNDSLVNRGIKQFSEPFRAGFASNVTAIGDSAFL